SYGYIHWRADGASMAWSQHVMICRCLFATNIHNRTSHTPFIMTHLRGLIAQTLCYRPCLMIFYRIQSQLATYFILAVTIYPPAPEFSQTPYLILIPVLLSMTKGSGNIGM